jgi:hypothetical protein
MFKKLLLKFIYSKINIISFKWNCNDTLIFVGVAAENYSIQIYDADNRKKLEECPKLTVINNHFRCLIFN